MIYRVSQDTEMTLETLTKWINRHKATVANKDRPLQNAYENKYAIFDQEAKASGKPDNRIAINFAKYITDTFNGFFCGIPAKVTSEDENVQEYVDYLNKSNDGDNTDAELSKNTDITGSSFEMYYVRDDGEIGITYLTSLESFMLVDDSILERPMYFVRYYVDPDGLEHGSYSDSKIVRHFVKDGDYKWDDEPQLHGFEYVPAVEYIANTERMGLYQSAMSAIDAYNKALSEKANDVDYFADAYMKIIGPKVDDTDTAVIRNNRIVNFVGDLSDGNSPIVEFMQRPSADEAQENLLNRLLRDIFIESMVANIADENFGATGYSTTSGIALKFKMEAMNNLFTSKARRFTSSMMDRYRIIFSNPIAQMNGVSKDDWTLINIKFTQNYPANLESEAEVAKALEGIVSKETQLKVLSLVDNIKDEVERLETEQTTSVVDNLWSDITQQG